MKELEINELKKLDGGGISIGITELFLLSAGAPFIIGVIDGFLRPLPNRI